MNKTSKIILFLFFSIASIKAFSQGLQNEAVNIQAVKTYTPLVVASRYDPIKKQ